METEVATTRARRLGRVAKSALDVIATIMVIVASTAVLALTIANWRDRPDSPPVIGGGPVQLSPSPPPPDAPHDLDGAALMGSRNARVVLVQYSDFECPFCGQFVRDTWPELKKRYVESGKVLAAFRHLPLPRHQNAKQAAVAANCAGRQGKFWQMHDGLFEPRSALTPDVMRGMVSRLQLDAPAYEQCVRDYPTDNLSADNGYANKFRIQVTPTFLIGVMTPRQTVDVTNVLVGAQPLSAFTAVLDDLLSQRSK
jgi:protein-disulfide isomerase